jgi:hypothetical protein
MEGQWWVLGNRYGGYHTACARTEKEARERVRAGIAEAFLGEGLSPSAARRAARTYRICVVAGGCTKAEAQAARGPAGDGDLPLVQQLHDRWIAGTRRLRMRISTRPNPAG